MDCFVLATDVYTEIKGKSAEKRISFEIMQPSLTGFISCRCVDVVSHPDL